MTKTQQLPGMKKMMDTFFADTEKCVILNETVVKVIVNIGDKALTKKLTRDQL